MSYGMPSLVVGNLTADPELQTGQSGKQFVRLNIANTPRVKNGNEWTDGPASFVSVTLFDHYAVNTAASLKKGHRVIAFGELEKRTWTDKQSGAEREGLQLENVTYFGLDLRFVTAVVTKAGAARQGGQGAPNGYGPGQGAPGGYGPQGGGYAPPQGGGYTPNGGGYAPPQGYPQQGQMPPQQGQPPQQGGYMGPGLQQPPQQGVPPQQEQLIPGQTAPWEVPGGAGQQAGYNQYGDETPF